MNVDEQLDRLHQVWFGESPESGVSERIQKLWFGKDPELDRMLNERFGTFHDWVTDQERELELASSIKTDRRIVSLIVLLDQVSRNLHRGRPEAYANDNWALDLSKQMVEEQRDKNQLYVERAFIYMPYRHSERLETQEEGVRLYQQLREDAPIHWQEPANEFLDYARRSCEVIDRFGRFPHRNQILGREDTPEEERYLSNPGGRF